MSPILQLLRIDKKLDIPVYLQIANGVINAVKMGQLVPGASLPPSRQLAAALDVHRKTVVAAYDELYAQSWVHVVPRKGIFIASELPEVTPQPIPYSQPATYATKSYFELNSGLFHEGMSGIALADQHLHLNEGFPDTRLAPIELLIREYRRFGNYHFTPKYLMYGPVCGSDNLRREVAGFLADTRGLNVEPKHIMITKGAQMAFYLLAQVLLTKGDVVVVADPGYDGANDVFRHAGATIRYVPVDADGIDVEQIAEICALQPVRAVYVIPHHHMPTTVSLSPERRVRLLELARQYRFAIFEDDYDYDFHYNSSPILPLASADYSGSVVYIGTFCKTIAPGIRIGFVVAPPDLIGQMGILRKMIDRQGEQLLEEAMANLLQNGDIARHLKKMNKIYHERRDLLCSLLATELRGKVRFEVPDGGFAVWTEYLNGIDPKRVAAKALEMGLRVGDGSGYWADPGNKQNFVRLGFASMNETELREAVRILSVAFERAEQEEKWSASA